MFSKDVYGRKVVISKQNSLYLKKSNLIMAKTCKVLILTISLECLIHRAEPQHVCPGLIINSNCDDSLRSTWNSKYIGQSIKEWIKSVEISFSPKNPNKVHSKERYKVVRNPETGTLLHLSVTNCSSKRNIGPMWQIAGENLRLGQNEFNDGYFYMTSREFSKNNNLHLVKFYSCIKAFLHKTIFFFF